MGKRRLTAEDVLEDIEFEIIQGAIPQNELGQGLVAVKQYQNKIRNEIFESIQPRGDIRKITTRLLHLNDMLITLLQEMISTIQALHLEMQHMAQGSKMPAKATPESTSDLGGEEAPSPSVFPTEPSMWVEDEEEAFWKARAEIEEMMSARRLRLEMNVRPSGIPVLGKFLKQFRIALHTLVLFYANQLASKQGEVNQTYGEWLLYLNEQLRLQREQIASLREQVAELQARRRGDAPTDDTEREQQGNPQSR